MIDYITFITKYTFFGNPPYIQTDVESTLEEVSTLFPQIYTCIPEESRLLATYYAFRHLLMLNDECADAPGIVESYETRNDKIKFSLRGKGFELVNSTWGSRLNSLFRIHGCFINTEVEKVECNVSCGC